MEGWVELGYPAMHRPGVELAISWSQVQRLAPLHHRAAQLGHSKGTCSRTCDRNPQMFPLGSSLKWSNAGKTRRLHKLVSSSIVVPAWGDADRQPVGETQRQESWSPLGC